MNSDERTLLASKIILNALFPVMKIAVSDDPAMNKRFNKVNAKIQFGFKSKNSLEGAALIFTDGKLEIEQGVDGFYDLGFFFGSPEKFNAFMAGKPVIPKIKGFLTKPLLTIKIVTLLLAMKILMPNVNPKDPSKKILKVKMVVFMITTALSQYNKGGDPEMAAWTKKQPDRIYQMTIEEEGIAAWLRVKAGKTKAGRGIYTKRRPFVNMKFANAEKALPVFLNEIEFVEAVGRQYVSIEGSPEYAANLNDFMQRIQTLIV